MTAKRTCADPSCITILSQYNTDVDGLCSIHQTRSCENSAYQPLKAEYRCTSCMDMAPKGGKSKMCEQCHATWKHVRARIRILKARNFRIILASSKDCMNHPTPDSILRIVAHAYGLTYDVFARSLEKKEVWARRVAVYLLRADLQCSFEDIKNVLRSNGCKGIRLANSYFAVADEMSSDPAVKLAIERIRCRYRVHAIKEAME